MRSSGPNDQRSTAYPTYAYFTNLINPLNGLVTIGSDLDPTMAWKGGLQSSLDLSWQFPSPQGQTPAVSDHIGLHHLDLDDGDCDEVTKNNPLTKKLSDIPKRNAGNEQAYGSMVP
jgi:hypothetical protein